MVLRDVIRVLAEQVEPLGFSRVDLYKILFQGILDEQIFGIEDTVKQLFSGSRPLKGSLMRALCQPDGFDLLCKNIRVGYLPVVGDHAGIYDTLSRLLCQCPYMREDDVKKIIMSCDASQDAGLARLIAACLVCGSYHTGQHGKKAPKLGVHYGLNLDYMQLGAPMEALSLKNELWKASQAHFITERREGSRFHGLDIIQRLLPQGYVSTEHFLSRGQTEDGVEAPLSELCAQSTEDIAVVGDGGIGKTTFLQNLLEAEFLLPNGEIRSYPQNHPVPFFIELNRCPDHIGDWYEDSLRKTNFITRYIGQIAENHATLDSVLPETLTSIEKELQRIPEDGKPQYLLLLDGFNEVRADYSIRSYLSNEISVLHKYPNVRIITTSRETQATYYASDFKNIRLVGLKDTDIVSHLLDCHIPEPVIGNAMACASLVKCLRIPLYLLMFSAVSRSGDYLPETAGEILYCFFHENSTFYNVRTRFAQTQPNRADNQKLAFILDFVLPYIGWAFENADSFSMSEQEFQNTISDTMDHIQTLFARYETNPFRTFQYRGSVMRRIWNSFYDQNENLDVPFIIAAVYDYLGIVYRYEIAEGPFADRIRYSFCHHHFRDYFSAMWDVRLLSMLQCVPAHDICTMVSDNPTLISTFNHFLNIRHWKTQKVGFISEILMEHRSRPRFNPQTRDWYLPEPKYDQQSVLANALDFCRKLKELPFETYHILRNILAAVLYGRKEYSGLDLSGLDLRGCSLFRITCSRNGQTKTLAAKFDRSILSSDNFQPEDHQNNVMECVYYYEKCFTIDDTGIIKCWDVLSGRLEGQMRSGDPLGNLDFSRSGYLKVSPDGRWIGAKVQESYPGGTHLFVNLFNPYEPGNPPIKIRPAAEHKVLSYFAFTEDSQSLLLLCDYNTVYCVDIASKEQHYCVTFDLYRQSELYADSADSDIFVHTTEYSTYEMDETFPDKLTDDDWDFSDDEDEDEEFPRGIPCELCILKPATQEKRTLYSFLGEPGTAPTVSYFPHQHCFLLYNYDGKHIERFDCISGERSVILTELTQGQDTPPAAICRNLYLDNECYILYPNICFSADVFSSTDGSILMSYPIASVEKLLSDSDLSGELEFKTNVVPAIHRFVVGNDSNTYEWDTQNDVLIRKYNCVYYECIALFTNSAKDLGILVHRHNGISIFRGTPPRLQAQYCFQEPEYLIDVACLDETNSTLALCFARPDHEKVVLLDFVSGIEQTIYSTIHPGETIENMCFSKDGCTLLITSQYQCLEYDVRSGVLSEVARAGSNERFAAGNYTDGEIEIAVVEHSGEESPHIEPYCVFYQRNMGNEGTSYRRVWCYLMPKLKNEHYQYFIYQCGDLGVGGSNGKDGFQQYWVTRGFFLEPLPLLMQYFQPKCYTWHGQRRLKMDKLFHPLDQLFVWHENALTNRYGVGDSGISHMYLADDRPEAILTSNRECLFYHGDLRKLTYQKLRDILQKGFLEAPENAYWDFAIPWSDGNLIGCFEFYKLISVAASDNKLLGPIHYYPGISILGCSFKEVNADAEALKIIQANGGIL